MRDTIWKEYMWKERIYSSEHHKWKDEDCPSYHVVAYQRKDLLTGAILKESRVHGKYIMSDYDMWMFLHEDSELIIERKRSIEYIKGFFSTSTFEKEDPDIKLLDNLDIVFNTNLGIQVPFIVKKTVEKRDVDNKTEYLYRYEVEMQSDVRKKLVEMLYSFAERVYMNQKDFLEYVYSNCLKGDLARGGDYEKEYNILIKADRIEMSPRFSSIYCPKTIKYSDWKLVNLNSIQQYGFTMALGRYIKERIWNVYNRKVDIFFDRICISEKPLQLNQW